MTTVRYTTFNGDVIAEKRNGSRRLYVPDPLGSTVALLDNTQTQVDTFTYWPFGEVRTSTGTTPPPFQFVGTKGYYSDGIGRAYVRARNLHTAKARWLTEDPIRNPAGDTNAYMYSHANPVSVTDPSGLFCVGPDPKCDPSNIGQCMRICDRNKMQLHDCTRHLFTIHCQCCKTYSLPWGQVPPQYRGNVSRSCGATGSSYCQTLCGESGTGYTSSCIISIASSGSQTLKCTCCKVFDDAAM